MAKLSSPPRSGRFFLPFLALGLLVPATGCTSGGATVLPCDTEQAPTSCGAPCSNNFHCDEGTYCGEEESCTADCMMGTDMGCGSGELCTADGRCVTDFRRPDVGVFEDPDDTCAQIELQPERIVPNVVVLVDQSGSMTAGFGGGTRWGVLRESLIGGEGLVPELADLVNFRLALYTAFGSGPDGAPAEEPCPVVTELSPEPSLTAMIEAYESEGPEDETPTGDSIDYVIENLVPDLPSDQPTIFILATDGEPDSCEVANPQTGQAEAIAAVQRAHTLGIRTFVIGVQLDVDHLQEVANAGQGLPVDAPESEEAEFWPAGDDEDLRSALRQITGAELSCDVRLEGELLPENICAGQVRLDDDALPCNDPDGFEWAGPSLIRLNGMACEQWLNDTDAELEATFPCGTVEIF